MPIMHGQILLDLNFNKIVRNCTYSVRLVSKILIKRHISK